MTYGLISDIHSNIEALTAALAELTSADAFLCMGDIVGYGPDPIACIERLQSLPNLTCIAGNHDLAAIGRYSLDWFNDFARAAIEWTGARLSADAVTYLQGLDLTAELPDCFLVHGAYPNHMDYITTPADAMGTFESMPVSPCFIGHTHIAEYYRNRKSTRFADSHSALLGCSITLEPDLGYIVNPGSIGQPRDGNPDASFGIYDTEAQCVEIRRVSYDIAAVQKKMRKARLPQHLIERLPRGR
jgi:predicted phosphodiesterase